MAKEKEIVLKARVDSQQADQAINELSKDTQQLETDMDAVGDTTDKVTGGMYTAFTGVTKAIGSAIKSLRTLKGVLIASGIGLFAIAVGSVAKAFTNSEEGQNKFLRLMTQISVVTGNVFDIMEDLGKSILNLGKVFGKLILKNI